MFYAFPSLYLTSLLWYLIFICCIYLHAKQTLTLVTTGL